MSTLAIQEGSVQDLWNTEWAAGLLNSDNSIGTAEEEKLKKEVAGGNPRSPINNNIVEVKRDDDDQLPMRPPKQVKKRGRVGARKSSGSEDDRKTAEKKKSGGGGGDQSDDHDIHIWTERERRKKMRNMFSTLHALLPRLPSKADKSSIVDEAINYIKALEQTVQQLEKQKPERVQGGGYNMVTNNINNEFNYNLSSLMTPPQKMMAYHDPREAFLTDLQAGLISNPNNLAISNIIGRNPTNLIPPAPFFYPAATSITFQTWMSPNVVLNMCGDDAQISICSLKKPGLFSGICYVLEKHKIEVVSANIFSDSTRSFFMIQAHASRGNSDQFIEILTAEDIFKHAAGEMMLMVTS